MTFGRAGRPGVVPQTLVVGLIQVDGFADDFSRVLRPEPRRGEQQRRRSNADEISA
ncbi:MAG TPA: hypothetical protein VMI94_04335 [Bryobacteraceae bacterium]|nr:hypothetical protein [Bryobacteraceae bacterium]